MQISNPKTYQELVKAKMDEYDRYHRKDLAKARASTRKARNFVGLSTSSLFTVAGVAVASAVLSPAIFVASVPALAAAGTVAAIAAHKGRQSLTDAISKEVTVMHKYEGREKFLRKVREDIEFTTAFSNPGFIEVTHVGNMHKDQFLGTASEKLAEWRDKRAMENQAASKPRMS